MTPTLTPLPAAPPAPQTPVIVRHWRYRFDIALGAALLLFGIAALVFPSIQSMVIGILGGPMLIAKALAKRLTITPEGIAIGIPGLEKRIRWGEVQRIEANSDPAWRSLALVLNSHTQVPQDAWRQTPRMMSESGRYLIIPPIWEDMPAVEAASAAMLQFSRSAPPASQLAAAPGRRPFPMTFFIIVLAAAVAFMLMGVMFGRWREPAGMQLLLPLLV